MDSSRSLHNPTAAVSGQSRTYARLVGSKEPATKTEVTSGSTSIDQRLGSKEEGKELPKQSCVMQWLSTLTVVAVLFGVVVGLLCKQLDVSDDVLKFVGFPGDLFIRALKALVVPMIFCSMVTSTVQMCSGGADRMARWAIIFYLCTTVLAATTGILWFHIFKFLFHIEEENGDVMRAAPNAATATTTTIRDHDLDHPILSALMRLGKDLVPDNVLQAVVSNNLLGVIAFAIFFGYMLAQITSATSVISFFAVCFDTMVAMIRVVIHFTPVGVGSLVAAAMARSGDLGAMFAYLGALVSVTLSAYFFHVFITYAGLYYGLTRKNPYRFLAGLVQVWITAFGTSSSVATLSTTCEACERMGLSPSVINFVLPIGCTVNMDGGALDRTIVVLFVAYVSKQPLDLAGQLITALTSVLLSIGASPIPSSGLSSLVVTLVNVGVKMTPDVDVVVGLVLAIEWFVDGVRTMINCTGDTIGAAVIDHMLVAAEKIKDKHQDEGDQELIGHRQDLHDIV